MPVLRQMAGIYLRGALANQTMAKMSQEERQKANDLTIKVASHPEMAKH
jgi:hypothetical protein